jgi:hypothetical protein
MAIRSICWKPWRNIWMYVFLDHDRVVFEKGENIKKYEFSVAAQ